MVADGSAFSGLTEPRRFPPLWQSSEMFLDETATSTNMVRLRGRCPRGERLIDHVPHGHWKTITFVAGLRRRPFRWSPMRRPKTGTWRCNRPKMSNHATPPSAWMC